VVYSSTLRTEAAGFFETLVISYQTTWLHIPGDELIISLPTAVVKCSYYVIFSLIANENYGRKTVIHIYEYIQVITIYKLQRL
jgi:hypothetical protein